MPDPERLKRLLNPKNIIKLGCIFFLLGVIIFLLYTDEDDYRLALGGKESYGTEVDISQGMAELNGESYRYNDHLSNFLFLGIDRREFADTVRGNADGGQSDAIYLVSMDRTSGEAAMVSIPRDSMVYCTEYAVGGDESLTLWDHLCVQYAYGDGRHESCNLSKMAVSKLLYGLPIQGYCAIVMDAMPVLADAVGGVMVQVPNDSLSFRDDEFQAGSYVVITGENAEFYLRTRDTEDDDTAIDRMNRQRDFLKAWLSKARLKYREDPSILTKLLEDIKPYMVTNISNDQFAKLIEESASGNPPREWVIPGEDVTTEEYDEFHVDRDALYERLVQTVCIKTE